MEATLHKRHAYIDNLHLFFKIKLTVARSGEGDGVAVARIIAFVMILCVQSGAAR